jgi:hypothetical protein
MNSSHDREKADQLQAVIKCLSIQDVYMRGSQVHLADTFDPTQPDIPLTIRFKIATKESHYIGNSDDRKPNIMRFLVEGGIRFMPPDDKEKDQGILAEITAGFVADYYVLEDNIIEEGIEQFANQNVIYHVWPYLREYVESMCQRFRLPTVVLPMYQVPPENRAQTKSE